LYYYLNGGAYWYTYNGTPQGVNGTATGYFNNPVNGTFTYAYYDSTGTQLPGTPTAAGSYTFTEYFTSLDPNYSSGTFSYSFAIYGATPTVTVTGGPFTYNGQGQAATATAVGIDGVTPVPGTASFTYNGSSSTPVLAGTYAVVATFTPTDPNYSSSTGSGTIVIDKATPAFSNLSSPTVKVGATTVTVSGHIAAGSAAPGGDDVAITLNGVTQAVSINSGESGGSFSTTFNIAGLATGTYAITYQYLGDATRFGAAGAGSGTLTVQAPLAILTNPASQTVVSGSGVTFSASAIGYPAPTVQWQQSTDGTFYSNISGAIGLSFTITTVTASQNGYRYRAVFTNVVGSATTAAATLTVQSASTVPAAGLSGPSSGVTGQPLNYTLAAVESGLPAGTTYSYSVQWGDGSPVQTLAGPSGTQASHVYTAPGAYTVGLTATDPSGQASAPVTLSVSGATALMEADPYNSSLTALYFGGTTGNDTIAFSPAPGNGVKAAMNFVSYGSFYPTGHVVVYGQITTNQGTSGSAPVAHRRYSPPVGRAVCGPPGRFVGLSGV
jgi:hypothetical protein